MSNTLAIAIKIANENQKVLKELQSELEGVEGGGKKAGSGLQQAGDHAEKAGKQADGSRGLFGGLSSALKSIGTTAAGFVVGQGLLKLPGVFSSAVGGASDLNENLSKVQVVFGTSAGAIDAWSQTASSAFGQSRSEALAAAGTFGNFFKTLGVGQQASADMSKNLVQLAGDLASFDNADPSEVIEALGSALRGEAEPMAKFGVLMNDTTLKNEALKLGLISSTKDALNPQAKAMAAYGLVLEQTKTAQGDFARTSDGNANQLRILHAKFKDLRDEIGTALLPVVVKAGQLLLQYLPPTFDAIRAAIGYLEPKAKTVIEWLKDHLPGATVAAANGLAIFLGGVATTVNGATQGFALLVTVVTKALSGILKVANELGGGIYKALQWINPFAPHSPPLVDQVRDGVKQINEDFAKLAQANASLNSSEGAVRGFETAMSGTARALEAADLAGKLEQIRRTGGDEAVRSYQAATAAIGDMRSKYEQLGSEVATTKGKLDALGTSLETQKGKLQGINDKIALVTQSMDKLKGTPILEEKKFDDAGKAIQRQMDQINLQIVTIKQSGPLEFIDADGETHLTSAGKKVEALQKQLDALDLAAQKNDLQKNLAIDPLKDKLDDLTGTAPLPFDAIYDGVKKAQGQLDGLNKQQITQQGVVDDAQKAYDTLKTKLDGQTSSYDQLGRAIEASQATLDKYAASATTAATAEDARARAAEAVAKASDLSTTATDATTTATDALDTALASIDPSVLDQIASSFGDSEDSADGMAESMQKASENMESLKKSFGNVKKSATDLWASLKPVRNVVGEIIDFAQKHKQDLIVFGIAFAVLVPILYALASALTVTAVAEGVALLPVIALSVALAALVLGVYELWKHWDDLEKKYPIIQTVSDNLKTAFENFVNWIKDPFLPTVQSIYDKVSTVVGDAAGFVNDHWHEVQDPIAAFVEWVKDPFIPTVKSIYDTISGAVADSVGFVTDHWHEIQDLIEPAIIALHGVITFWWDAISLYVDTTINVIKDTIGIVMALIHGDWDGAWNGLKTLLSDIWTGVGGIVSIVSDQIDVIKGFITALPKFFADIGPDLVKAGNDFGHAFIDKAGEAIKWGINNLILGPIETGINYALGFIAKAVGVLKGLADAVPGPNPFGDTFQAAIDALNKGISIPRLKDGAIVTKATLALIGEDGPEAVVPLSKGPKPIFDAGGIVPPSPVRQPVLQPTVINVHLNGIKTEDPEVLSKRLVHYMIRDIDRANGRNWKKVGHVA